MSCQWKLLHLCNQLNLNDGCVPKTPSASKPLTATSLDSQNQLPLPLQSPPATDSQASSVSKKQSRQANPFTLQPQFKTQAQGNAATPQSTILQSASTLAFNLDLVANTPELLIGTPSTPADSSAASFSPQTPAVSLSTPSFTHDPLFSVNETPYSPLVDSMGLEAMTLESPFIPNQSAESEERKTRKP
ncbi:hypothetical protein PQX77_019757 [Marasmius sp. AFHP31]|nr:hypothetical protein PQX77_019757 [Marasmius sp. AFHP31]